MKESYYSVIITGVALGISPQKVIDNVSRLFKTDPSKFQILAKGEKIIVRKQVDKRTAIAYQSALEKAGCLVSLKPLFERSPVSSKKQNKTTSGGTICPKCKYIRKATDLAPDYECPKCGFVYAKAKKDINGSNLSIAHQDTKEEENNNKKVNWFIEGWNWYLYAWTREKDNEGRSTRKEFFYFWLFYLIILGLPFKIIEMVLGYIAGLIVGVPIFIAHLRPLFNVTVRRLHDAGHSGWWMLVPLVRIYFFLEDSQPYDNIYGTLPKKSVKIKHVPKLIIGTIHSYRQFFWSKKIGVALLAVVALLSVGRVFEMHISSKFNDHVELVKSGLNFNSKAEFNENLDNLVELMEYTAFTVYEYERLPPDDVAHYVLETIALSDKFMANVRDKAAEEDKDEIYGYSVKDINDVLLDNCRLLVFVKKNKNAQFIIEPSLVHQGRFSLLKGGRLSGKIQRPQPIYVMEQIRKKREIERNKRQAKELAQQRKFMRAMEIRSLRRACQQGARWACEELKDIESGRTDPLVRSR